MLEILLFTSIISWLPGKLITVPTASTPQKFQLSIIDAGLKVNKVFLRIDPILLPSGLNLGIKVSLSSFFVSFNVSKFYGSGYIKRENVDRISINADGFNISAGYTFSSLTGIIYYRKYGDQNSTGGMLGMFLNPIMAEAGFDSYEQLRFGAGFLVKKGNLFVKLGIFSSAKTLKEGKLVAFPSVNFGYTK